MPILTQNSTVQYFDVLFKMCKMTKSNNFIKQYIVYKTI